MESLRVTVWNEFVHERKNPHVKEIYPHGIHGVLCDMLNRQPGIIAQAALLDQPDHGLTENVLANTDVLTWWGHCAHDEVSDEIVTRVQRRVLQGMGLIVLHSGHFSKIFKRLMGTTCLLNWREAGERERVWVVNPGHPIAAGIGHCIEVPSSEMYGEPFDVPAPAEQVFLSWFEGGEVLRSGATWFRGNGRIFYFSPGHELYPIYHQPEIQRVICNAVRWAKPQGSWIAESRHVTVDQALEPIKAKGPSLHDSSGHIIR